MFALFGLNLVVMNQFDSENSLDAESPSELSLDKSAKGYPMDKDELASLKNVTEIHLYAEAVIGKKSCHVEMLGDAATFQQYCCVYLGGLFAALMYYYLPNPCAIALQV